MLSMSSLTAHASTCDKPEASAHVSVAYIGNTELTGKGWSIPQGKYRISNNSTQKIQLSGYKTQPLTIYRHDTGIEREDSNGSWVSDVAVLEEPLPPTKVVTLKPGQQVEIAAERRDDSSALFRFKVRLKSGCWATSEPFRFTPVK